jgi:hypothetical protein
VAYGIRSATVLQLLCTSGFEAFSAEVSHWETEVRKASLLPPTKVAQRVLVKFHTDVKIGDLGFPCVDLLVIDGSCVAPRLSDVSAEVCCESGTLSTSRSVPGGRHVRQPLI